MGYKLYANTFVDDFIWGTLYAGLIIAGYQYFFDRYKTSIWKNKLRTALFIFFIANMVFVGGALLALWLNRVSNDFFYASAVIPMILFTFITLARNNALRHKILLWGCVAFIPSVLYEYVALTLNQWTFNSHSYLFVFRFANHLIPIEEILWFFFAVTFMVCLHEVLVDDGK